MTPRLVSVLAHQDFTLSVEFDDGLQGTVDCAAMIHGPRAGVFAALRDPGLFASAFIEYGAVAWPGDLDLAPDAMHAAMQTGRNWRLE